MDNQQNITQNNTPEFTQNPNLNRPKKFKSKKKILLVALLVLLVLAAFGSLYYWTNSKNQELQRQLDSANVEIKKLQAEESETKKPESPTDETPTTSTNSDDGYLVITQYGVKVKLSDADKVTYSITGNPGGTANADNVQSYATIILKNSTQGSKCASIGLSLTQRVSGDGTKIGTSYYGFDGGEPLPCGDAQKDALRTQIYKELVNAQILAE